MVKKPEKEKKNMGKDIESTLDAIKTKFGEEAIMMLGDRPKVGVDAISTGSIGLDGRSASADFPAEE